MMKKMTILPSSLIYNKQGQLNLFVYPTKNLSVKVANGHQVDNTRCHKISVQVQELEINLGFYVLPLDGMDMVLGAKWLMQLGTYTTNLEEQFTDFHLHVKHYKLCDNEGFILKEEEPK